MATIRDVAEKAGVTVTTVSRVLNNRGYISEKTRKKVYEAMKELNYQPNELARSLYRRKSYLIGLLIPSVAHPFFAELTNYIEYYAYQNDYKILLCNSLQDVEKEKDYINMLKRHQVDGIIIGSHTLKMEQYLNVNLPIVAIDRYFSEKIPYVASDNYNGGVLATKLLIQKGCKKIAHISGPLILNTPANNRYKAFMDVVTENNIESVVVETKINKFDIDEYRRLIINLFKEHQDIDGVFASSDLIAATIINVAREFGKEVPKDLKVVGYDDINIAKTIVPPLTTIRQPIKEMAKKSIELILDQVDGKNVNIKNVLPITLVERESA
ncbi:LacI family DNA-binding transcriptional regulator [Thermoanaerobacterium sp. CMT5567-10]|uniref:LacI family transcriptional regulator n=1 Tax=Thermoanaerobacterium thermosaccharolyticum TaxID=1517 RepID=A0A231VCV8_THETR|nr:MULTISPECIES: LacI family DNA-binding transcriptional regulator [Thermoanaerobacterium]OXT05980.1 LacI family transcriptional regulator [Thermoanaerobacterium thermosaccharolyticum]WKV09589.1 LacI family DNA-binding transcriptional regulator [Thermoanaerobacterium sp. CMT5567-10]